MSNCLQVEMFSRKMSCLSLISVLLWSFPTSFLRPGTKGRRSNPVFFVITPLFAHSRRVFLLKRQVFCCDELLFPEEYCQMCIIILEYCFFMTTTTCLVDIGHDVCHFVFCLSAVACCYGCHDVTKGTRGGVDRISSTRTGCK